MFEINHDKKTIHLTAEGEGVGEIRIPTSRYLFDLIHDHNYTYVFHDKEGKEIDVDARLRISGTC